jgi:hypothetical protein
MVFLITTLQCAAIRYYAGQALIEIWTETNECIASIKTEGILGS